MNFDDLFQFDSFGLPEMLPVGPDTPAPYVGVRVENLPADLRKALDALGAAVERGTYSNAPSTFDSLLSAIAEGVPCTCPSPSQRDSECPRGGRDPNHLVPPEGGAHAHVAAKLRSEETQVYTLEEQKLRRDLLAVLFEPADTRERPAERVAEEGDVEPFVDAATQAQRDVEARWNPSPDQAEALTKIQEALREPGMYAFTGAAGCHPAGTRVMRADGSCVPVETIQVGDRLMGMDGCARTVLRLIRGHGAMFKVTPTKGAAFYVNGDHILTLVGSKYARINGKIIDVAVNELTDYHRKNFKLFRAPVARFERPSVDLPLDPYFLGVLLGDGTFNESPVSVSKPDAEIEACVRENAKALGMRVHRNDSRPCPAYEICVADGTPVGPGYRSPIRLRLEALGLWAKGSGERFIPACYKYGSRETRLALLAGLLDTDGHMYRSCFDYLSLSKQLTDDVTFVARSLGLAAYPQPCEKYCQTGGGGTYYRAVISGDCSMIPTRIPRKQAPARQQVKDVLRTGFTVKPASDDNYYGFTLDGDGRYLLDDFTVTHNCGKTTVVKAILRSLSDAWEVLLVAPTWRAALRLREVTGCAAQSLHSAIYGAPVMMRQCGSCTKWSSGLAAAQEGEEDQEVELNGQWETVKVPTGTYTCEHCQTVFRDVTLFPQALKFEPRLSENVKPLRLVVVDEASMCNTKALKDDIERALLNGKTRVLLVGDINQLPPVTTDEERRGPPDPLGLLKPVAKLTTIHRQGANDPILTFAHRYKTDPMPAHVSEWPFALREHGIGVVRGARIDQPAMWAAERRRVDASAALIAFSNATRAKLNFAVRNQLGLLAASRGGDAPLVVGDRVLFRSNGAGAFNGQVWTVGQIWRAAPGTKLLDRTSRVRGGHTRYEVDQLLGRYSIGVWQAALHGIEGWSYVTLVLPLDGEGRGLLESDLIVNMGMRAQEARQLCREIARLWKTEAADAYEARTQEFLDAKSAANGRRQAEPLWLAAKLKGDTRAAERFLKRMIADSRAEDVEAKREHLRTVEGTEDELRQAARVLDSVSDIAAKHESVEGYLTERYGAVPLGSVVSVDYGECLTGHAMQGSQAVDVAIAADGALFGAWKNDPKGAMQWIYTAATRAEKRLFIFQIKKDT